MRTVQTYSYIFNAVFQIDSIWQLEKQSITENCIPLTYRILKNTKKKKKEEEEANFWGTITNIKMPEYECNFAMDNLVFWDNYFLVWKSNGTNNVSTPLTKSRLSATPGFSRTHYRKVMHSSSSQFSSTLESP